MSTIYGAISRWHPHRIDGDDPSLDRRRIRQFGNGDNIMSPSVKRIRGSAWIRHFSGLSRSPSPDCPGANVLRYSVHLRRGMTWHAGRDCPSDDVAVTIFRLQQARPRGPITYDNVIAVDTPDPHIVVIVRHRRQSRRGQGQPAGAAPSRRDLRSNPRSGRAADADARVARAHGAKPSADGTHCVTV